MKIDILKSVLVTNEAIAAENRRIFDKHRALVINLMSSPGAGKTSLIERTIKALGTKYKIAVIEGDIAGNIDAQRINNLGVPVIQINTGGECHLDAHMVRSSLPHLPSGEFDLIIIENVGNLVCPAEFNVGEDFKAMILSLPEGDDKVKKYPLMFHQSKVLLVNKMDLVDRTDFNFDTLNKDLQAVNPKLKVFKISCKSDMGIDQWIKYLEDAIIDKKKNFR
ncbi:MAG: hydrogenase nickel incorporation protein HypB [candidate division WOR-3 bacterium]